MKTVLFCDFLSAEFDILHAPKNFHDNKLLESVYRNDQIVSRLRCILNKISLSPNDTICEYQVSVSFATSRSLRHALRSNLF